MSATSEIMDRIVLLLSSIGIISSLFFAILLLVTKNKYAKANVFLAMYLLVFGLRMAKSVFYNYYTFPPTLHHLFLGSLLLVGPSLWFYALQLRKQPIQKIALGIHYFPFILFSSCSGLLPDYGSSSVYLVLFLHGMGYSVITAYSCLNETHISSKRWILLLSMVTVAMFLNSTLIFFAITPFFPSSAFLFSGCMTLLTCYALGNLSLFQAEPVKYANSNVAATEVAQQYKKLKALMEEKKLYLDSELSLSKLSTVLGISSKQLSQVINQTESVNFSQYIANYRIAEAKNLLKNPKYSDCKIAAIAYESGFNSISAFNAAFKKRTHTTASKFRESEKSIFV